MYNNVCRWNAVLSQYSHFYLIFGYFDDVDSQGQRVHF